MKIKTSELIGPALDWAVAMCRGFDRLDEDQWLMRDGISDMPLVAYNPSSDWAQGGPIVEQEGVEIFRLLGSSAYGWGARKPSIGGMRPTYCRNGPTPLVAAMRCFVASKLGDKVDVPETVTCHEV